MSREWKPGDVAMVDGHVAFVWDDECSETQRLSFIYTDADGDACSIWAEDGTDARPLIVIDPASADVERLTGLFWERQNGDRRYDDDAMQAALREFATPTPPRPDEPQGLGAVAEAICACNLESGTFVRNGHVDPNDPWESLCGWHVWADFKTVVRVLSEGVTT